MWKNKKETIGKIRMENNGFRFNLSNPASGANSCKSSILGDGNGKVKKNNIQGKEGMSKSDVTETEDGCPFAFDFGKFNFQYKQPKICTTLIPESLQDSNPTHLQDSNDDNNNPFSITLEPPPDPDDNFYPVTVSILEGFDATIAAAVLQIQRIKGDGKANPDDPAGHLEGQMPWKDSYCCAKSKFKSLIVYLENDPDSRKTELNVKWYPMNFGEGKIKMDANIFPENDSYWTISKSYKIPIPMPIAEK